MNENASNNRRGSVEGVIQRCGLCSLLSSLLRRAMCVGSRRGSGESYYQELANAAVSVDNVTNSLTSQGFFLFIFFLEKEFFLFVLLEFFSFLSFILAFIRFQ